jgi:hypothetical protein
MAWNARRQATSRHVRTSPADPLNQSGGLEVPGSNPGAPTKRKPRRREAFRLYFFGALKRLRPIGPKHRKGDVVAFPRGDEGLHQGSNRTDTPIRVLMVLTGSSASSSTTPTEARSALGT